MTKNMLTYLSHQFCINCCGEHKKLDCDTRSITCDKLAGFLVGCHKFQEPIDEEKLDELANEWCKQNANINEDGWAEFDGHEAYKAGYKKAMEE